MARSDRLVLIGKIAATHGIRGQLRVIPYSGDPESITALTTFLVKGAKGEMEPCEVAQAVQHGKRVLVSIKPYDNINQVRHLVGRELYVRREQLPELPDGEFYWFDLIGLRVVTDGGEPLGTLEEIFATGSNDVYVVKGERGEVLVPALEDVVQSVDLDRGEMTVALPEGLLEQ